MHFLEELKNKNLTGKICLLRVDFNIEDLNETLRLETILPTLNFLLKKKVKTLILSHRGRPQNIKTKSQKSKINKKKFTLKIVLPFLRKKFKQKIGFLSDLDKLKLTELFKEYNVVVLENLRFWSEEEKNDLNFAKKLAELGDFYINDAFAVSHRWNSSVTQLPKLLPSYGGFLLEKEIKILSRAMSNPKKPLILIFGGSKIDDKMSAIKNLLPKTDKVLLGSSIIKSKIKYQISLKQAEIKKITKPVDWISEKNQPFDIGAMTIKNYIKEIKKAKTIIWNGPVGKFEDKKFARGSIALAKAIIKSKAFSIIGGGETTTLFQKTVPNYRFLILRRKIFLSTGGGAMLEFLAGKKLPGIAALEK